MCIVNTCSNTQPEAVVDYFVGNGKTSAHAIINGFKGWLATQVAGKQEPGPDHFSF
jgi:hypothetical protein